jgi:hypothetical protein
MLCDEVCAGVLCDFNYADLPKLKQRYLEHYESVANHVDAKRILRYRVQDGWKPLCEFLDVQCPTQPFPRVNDAVELLDSGNASWNLAIRNSVRNVGLLVVVSMVFLLLLAGR